MVSCLVVKRHPVSKDAVKKSWARERRPEKVPIEEGEHIFPVGEIWEPVKYGFKASHIGDCRR